MEPAQPGPGEELNTGAVDDAAPGGRVVIVLRGGARGLEVLLVQRNPRVALHGRRLGVPRRGGRRADGEGDAALRAAGVREVAEEAGVAIADPAELVPFSRWITPAEVKIRFDTLVLPRRVAADEPSRGVDGGECVDARWITPRARSTRTPRASCCSSSRRSSTSSSWPASRTPTRSWSTRAGARSSRSSRASCSRARWRACCFRANRATRTRRRRRRVDAGREPDRSERPHRRGDRADRRHRPRSHARARAQHATSSAIRAWRAARSTRPPRAGGRPSTARATCSTARAVDELVAGADVVVHLAFAIMGAGERGASRDQPRGLAQRVRGGGRRRREAARLHVARSPPTASTPTTRSC